VDYRFTTTAAQNKLLSKDCKNQLLFIECEFNGGIVRMHTGRGDKQINGDVFKGVGEVLSISDPVEEEGLNPSRLNVSLLFKDVTLFADLMQNDATGNEVTLYLALYDDNWKLIESTVYFQGDMDAPTIVEQLSHFTVSATITDFFEIWSRAIERARMTDAAHQAEYPNDKIFDQVERLAKEGIQDYSPNSYVGGAGGPSYNRNHNLNER